VGPETFRPRAAINRRVAGGTSLRAKLGPARSQGRARSSVIRRMRWPVLAGFRPKWLDLNGKANACAPRIRFECHRWNKGRVARSSPQKLLLVSPEENDDVDEDHPRSCIGDRCHHGRTSIYWKLACAVEPKLGLLTLSWGEHVLVVRPRFEFDDRLLMQRA
jgi:hypothetical protein